MFFDTHVHLNAKQFRHDQNQVIAEAQKNGVTLMINVSYNELSINQSIDLACRYHFIYAALGIHPHYVKDHQEDILDIIEQKSSHPKVVAVGEIGLDYYRHLSPVSLQQEWFIRQIHLAKKIQKPIIIHNRESDQDTVKIVQKEQAGEYGGIIHSFSGDKQMLKDVLDCNMHISISGPVTYNNSYKLREVIKYVPLERLLIETDCPYLSPEPLRRERNQPANVRYVAKEISRIKNMDIEDVAEQTTENAKKLFGIE